MPAAAKSTDNVTEEPFRMFCTQRIVVVIGKRRVITSLFTDNSDKGVLRDSGVVVSRRTLEKNNIDDTRETVEGFSCAFFFPFFFFFVFQYDERCL